jgi:hypothetical protein
MPQLIAYVEGVEIKHLYLQKDRTTLGRKPHNDIVLDNMVVSGEHCVFELEGLADVYISDLGSTNGTYVNDHMIKSRQKLNDHDVIAIGNFRIEFLAASEHDFSMNQDQTMAAPLDALGLPGTSGMLRGTLKVLSGVSAGLEFPVVKAVTTFGQAGSAVVSISHRRDGYYLSYVAGQTPPTLNGRRLGDNAIALAHEDVLSLAGTEMAFLLRSA